MIVTPVTIYCILHCTYNNSGLIMCFFSISSSGDTDISVSSDISKIVLVRSRDQLLAGLSDDAEQIRLHTCTCNAYAVYSMYK